MANASSEREAFALSIVEAARRAIRDAPIPTFFSATALDIGPVGPDSPVGILRDGETEVTFALAVGGFLPQIGERVYGVNVPPHGAVIFGRVGTEGSNGPFEDFQGFNGSSPTDALTAVGFTTWPVVMSSTVSVPPWATRMIAEARIIGPEQTTSSGVFEVQQVTGAGSGAVYRYSGGNGGTRYSVALVDEYDVTAFAGGTISARVDGRKAAGAGALNYDSVSRSRWLFRFYES